MIALGTPITYTHQAAIARKASKDMWPTTGEWFVPSKGNGQVPSNLMADKIWKTSEGRPFIYFNGNGEPLSSELVEKYNRALVAWEQPGSGVVTGLQTKMYGITHPSSYRMDAYGEDFDQGYLETHGKVELYTVRWELRGSTFIYVPTWAAIPQHAVA
jgi:hypothetical protein